MSGKESVPKKETRGWQDEEALRRYRLIAPLLDPEMDEGERRQLREETARKDITMYRFGTSSNKAILEILCPFLKCGKNVIVCNTAHLDNFQKLSYCFICKVSAMGVFSYKVVDVGDRRCRYKSFYFMLFTKPQNFV